MNRLSRVLIVLIVTLATAAPVSAHDQGYDYKMVPNPVNGYDHLVYVCFHSNFDGDNWATGTYATHATVSRALNLWNNHAIASGSTSMRFSGSNSSCNTHYQAVDPYVQIGYTTTGSPMWAQTYTVYVAGYGYRVRATHIWINTNYNFYWGTGSPGSLLDAWTMLGHEFGHASQIGHYAPPSCGYGSDIMVSCFSAGQTNRSLSSHDKDHYNHWYGTWTNP